MEICRNGDKIYSRKNNKSFYLYTSYVRIKIKFIGVYKMILAEYLIVLRIVRVFATGCI